MDTILTFASNRLFDTFREVEAGGKTWLVVNGVPLVEGVLNGRFVSADEFGAFPSDWNDIPIVLPHPKRNGGSARVPAPDVPTVGRFYNSKLDGKRLVGEYWLDKQVLIDLRDNEKSQDAETILNKIEKNQQIETSTGYWSESIPKAGRFGNRDYSYVDQNIHPDHIALLTQEVGACSLRDGCGMNRNSATCQTCSDCPKINAASDSYEGKIQKVQEAFNKQFYTSENAESPVVNNDYWVVETKPDHVVVSTHGEYFRVVYSMQDGTLVFDDRSEWKKAVRFEEFIVVQNVTGSLPAEGKKIYERVYQKYKDEDMSDTEAAKRAWGAVKAAGWYQDKDDIWHKKSKQNQQDLEGLAVALLLAESIGL